METNLTKQVVDEILVFRKTNEKRRFVGFSFFFYIHTLSASIDAEHAVKTVL